MTAPSTTSTAPPATSPAEGGRRAPARITVPRGLLARVGALAALYLAVAVALFLLYGPLGFAAPAFIYQAF
jgi:hypothetical protein